MYNDAQDAFELGADLVELRLDYLHELNIDQVKNQFRKFDDKLVLTLRKEDEGGKFRGKESERIELLEKLLAWKGPYKDIELSTVSENPKLKSNSTIISWHNFEVTPSKRVLEEKLSSALKYGSIAKIVTTAGSLTDNITVLSLYSKRLRGRLIAFCMGEHGKVSRILAPKLGSPFMYGCLEGTAVAPGQIPISELRGFYELLEMA
jgi:3-dehydroquinate dehydratase type I